MTIMIPHASRYTISHIYVHVPMFFYQLRMILPSLNWLDTQGMFSVWLGLKSRQATDNQDYLTRDSKISIETNALEDLKSFLQTSLLITFVIGRNAVFVFHTICYKVRRSLHTAVCYELLCLPDYDIEITAGITGQQRMLSHPSHLISRLVCPGVSVILYITCEQYYPSSRHNLRVIYCRYL